jgi:hypothetical protein
MPDHQSQPYEPPSVEEIETAGVPIYTNPGFVSAS